MHSWSIRSICVWDYKKELISFFLIRLWTMIKKLILSDGLTPTKLLSRSSLILFLINLFISRLEIPILSLDIITMEIRLLSTIIYRRYMLVYSPEPCWLSKSSRLCVLFHFWFSKHLFYRESVHFWHRFLVGLFEYFFQEDVQFLFRLPVAVLFSYHFANMLFLFLRYLEANLFSLFYILHKKLYR